MVSTRRIGTFLALAASAMIASFDSFGSHIREAWDRAVHGISVFALKVVAGPLPAQDKEPTASLRGYVVHKAHQLFRLKRETPRIEASWRMCPST